MESNPYNKIKVAVIGGGPAGCMAAYFASKNGAKVTIFESKSPLHTLLYTGGGRCNLAHAEYDFKELAKFYPRGEKFLYSIFSKFCTGETLDFFDKIGVETYTQEDMRIFPTSNSAKDVREKFLNALKDCVIKKEKVTAIKKATNKFIINNDYQFNKVIIAIGGHAGFELAKQLGHNIIEPKPALVGLVTKNNFRPIQGVSLKNITAETNIVTLQDDILFTHEGITGPLAYKISSIHARDNFNKNNPLTVKLNLCTQPLIASNEGLNSNTHFFQTLLDKNSKKDIKNLLSEFVPKSLSEYLLAENNINFDKKCHEINGNMRDTIYKSLTEFKVNVISPAKDGEVVTSGGVDLKEINPKDMQSKLVEGLHFCGEVIDIDGFCGGFNLQNCWSTGFIAGNSI